MGTYATVTSLQTIMVGTSFSPSGMTTLADKCITWAENEVNKYLSKRYDLSSATFQTSTSIPPLVTSLTEQLSAAYLQRRLARGDKEQIKMTTSDIEMVVDNLKLIADYKLDLLDTSGDPLTDMSNTAYSVRSNTDDYAQTFDEDDPLNWAIDDEKLELIADERDV